MMLLYVCETCGSWQDVAAQKAFVQAFNKAVAKMPEAQLDVPQGVACLWGCGMMRQVTPKNKLCVVEKINSEAAGTINIEVGGKRYRGYLIETKHEE